MLRGWIFYVLSIRYIDVIIREMSKSGIQFLIWTFLLTNKLVFDELATSSISVFRYGFQNIHSCRQNLNINLVCTRK